MPTYTFTTNVSQPEFDEFVQSSDQCSILQSYKWADIKNNWGHFYTAVKDENGKIQAAALVLVKSLPGGFSMLYIPRGPVIDYTNDELVKFYFENLKKEAKKHHAVFVKMDPRIVINEYKSKERNENRIPELPLILKNMADAGCIHQGYPLTIKETIQPRFESVIHQSKTFADDITKNTKRNIRIADRHMVHIEHGHGELVDDFSKMMAATEERKQISLRDHDYFKRLMDTYQDDAVIFIAYSNIHELYKKTCEDLDQLQKQLNRLGEDEAKAKKKVQEKMVPLEKLKERLDDLIAKGVPEGDIPMAGTLVIKNGPIVEMPYGGLDGTYMKFMPQYKEYVENFRWAFDQGASLFSMGGVEGTLDDGLTDFKDHFSPLIQEMIGEFNLPVNLLLYKPVLALYNKRKGI